MNANMGNVDQQHHSPTGSTFTASSASADQHAPQQMVAPQTTQNQSQPTLNTSSHQSSHRSSNAPSSSLYQCADCQRRYSRPEHLARHIQTHTLGKRFSCDVCGKAFARLDLLKRHRLNHEADGDGSKKRRRTVSITQGRVSHACKGCAAARVRCEETKPCGRCRKRGIECESASGDGDRGAAVHLMSMASQQPNGHMGTIVDDNQQKPLQPPLFLPSASDSILAPQDFQLTTSETIGQGKICLPDLNQLLTPLVISDPVMELASSQLPQNDLRYGSNPHFSDFLRDVLTIEPYNQARIEEPQGYSILNFYDDNNIELDDIDFDFLNVYNNGEVPKQIHLGTSAGVTDIVDMSSMRQRLTEIWMGSPWQWAPSAQDNYTREQSGLEVPSSDTSSPNFQQSGQHLDRVAKDRLTQSNRDKMMGVLLSTTKNRNILARTAASFPSADALDDLITVFLASQFHEVSACVHHGTLSLNQMNPEYLLAAAAAGAVLTPVPTLRRFGFAIQEALRLAIPVVWEENNLLTRDISYIQAWMIQSDVAQWSGNRRKMELFNSHNQAPVTMLRSAGRYKRSSYPHSTVRLEDYGQVLEEKWNLWSNLESYKRLAYHTFIRDQQASMTGMISGVMSYAELTLALPCPRAVWLARTAEEWKTAYLTSFSGCGPDERSPTLHDALRDISTIVSHSSRIDAQLSIFIYLHALWGMVWEYRQLETVHRSWPPPTSTQGTISLVLSSRHQELCQGLHQFQLIASDILSPQGTLILDLLLMNLHVRLEDVQLFIGREGENEAKRVYPPLQAWVGSREARQAVWHASQILRAAKIFQRNHLKDFYAVSVHHACLCLWTYGVIIKAKQREQPVPDIGLQEKVYLDGPETLESQRFISAGRGVPTLRVPNRKTDGLVGEACIENPRACMEIGHEVLRMNFGGDEDILPPIVDNLCHLIKQLGNAAWAVGLG